MEEPAAEALTSLVLSEDGERAVARLEEAGCDPIELRLRVGDARRIHGPQLMAPRQLSKLIRQLAELEESLRAFAPTADSQFLFPPMGQPTPLHPIVEQLPRLRQVLVSWKDYRARNFRRERFWRISLCAYVFHRTGQYHDDDVATLWEEVDPSPDSNRLTNADTVSAYRQDHQELLAEFIKLLTSESVTPSDPIPPPPSFPSS